MKSKGNLIGAWAFLVGLIVAILAGLFGGFVDGEWIWWLLVLAGIVIGLFNVGVRETRAFLLSAAVLVVVSFMGQSALMIIPLMEQVLSALLILFVPATVVVALKAVFAIAKD